MLKHLTIKNYALIEHLELSPSPYLNVITGETGAGKSIMLGALGLLMGNRSDTKVLWNDRDKCITEGTFDIKKYALKEIFQQEDLDYDDNTVFRREISPGGKSRAFINDTPVTLEVMRKIGNLLMDIHSQHETLLLASQSFQLRLIDTFAENQKLIEEYRKTWEAFLQARKSYEKLVHEADALRQESDYIRFQLDEFTKASLEEHEQTSLESELKIMDNAEEIKNGLNRTLEILSRSEYASRASLADARNHLHNLTSYSANYDALYKRLNSLLIELDDILLELEKEETKIEFNPERAEFVKERLSTIYRLLKKHRAKDLKELLKIQETLQSKASLTANLDDELAKAKNLFGKTEAQLKKVAADVTDSRQKVFEPLCKQLVDLLKDLGIPNAVLSIDRKPTEPNATGADSIEILFSANKGILPRPLAQVASGGEFSRLMFCIKYVMAEKTAMPTLVLDEIDSGVSGEIAIKLGKLMKSMAKRHQIITISHLPQIAAKGHAHYFVYKDNSSKKTISNIRMLGEQERVEEIAKMIGGTKPSKVALENAQELLSR